MTATTEKAPPRHSGLLLHITSLPGPGGVGDLGPQAHHFVDLLARAGQSLWQVLPLGPTGFGDSPYQLLSSFAGNPLLVNLEVLCDLGLLTKEELAGANPPETGEYADYGAAQGYRLPLLSRAAGRLLDRNDPDPAKAALRQRFERFCAQQHEWLEDFVLFMALKEEHGGAPWYQWPAALRDRQPEALWLSGERLRERTALHRFAQWQFFEQWGALHEHARRLGVALVGDMPIFVAHDSVELWTGREQFLLREDGSLKVQAGVPPDYFSKTGQLWGNPLYDWRRMEAAGFPFWRQRVRHALSLFDRVRIDHFRGFAAHWEVPADAKTAIGGRWVPAPGAALFAALQADHGGTLPLIAEDLGIITADVEALRDRFGFPGMRVLQFAFGCAEPEKVRPYSFRRNLVVYTSTHDNDTFVGWYRSGGEAHGPQDRLEQRNFLDYVGAGEQAQGTKGPPMIGAPPVHRLALRLALSTVAESVIIPVQDVLGLGSEGRMNRPGHARGNWGFRLRPGQITDEQLGHLRHLTEIYGRLPPKPQAQATQEVPLPPK